TVRRIPWIPRRPRPPPRGVRSGGPRPLRPPRRAFCSWLRCGAVRPRLARSRCDVTRVAEGGGRGATAHRGRGGPTGAVERPEKRDGSGKTSRARTGPHAVDASIV